MGICSQCTHFRRVKPASQLIGAVIAGTDAAVSNALTKIVEDEQKQRDGEAEYKRLQATAENEIWAMRPVMSDYCGFREAEEIFLIAEVKNFGGRCGDFVKGRPERRSCSDCAHRIAGAGPAEDAAMEKTFADMAVASIAAEASAGGPENLLNKYREGVASRKGFEVSGIYAAQGILAAKPKYFDHCGALSHEGEYVVCVVANPHHTCSSWSAAAATAAAAGPVVTTTVMATTAVSTTPSTPVAGAAVSQPFVPPVLPKLDIGPAVASTAPPDANVVVVGGDPSLTRGMMYDYRAFLEWILDLDLSGVYVVSIEAYLVNAWEQNNTAEIANIVQQLAAFQQVKSAEPALRAYWREDRQAEFVAGLRASNVLLFKNLLLAYDEVNKPLAPGEPPLTREMADATLRLLSFLEAASRNGLAATLPADAAANWRRQLIAQYPRFSREQRTAIAEMPRIATQVEAAWGQLSDASRVSYAQQLKAQFGGILPAAPAWSGAAHPGPPGPVIEQQYSDPLRMMEDVIAEQDREIAELMKTNPQLAIQKKLQYQQVNATMMSNIMKKMHETSMAIINNIK